MDIVKTDMLANDEVRASKVPVRDLIDGPAEATFHVSATNAWAEIADLLAGFLPDQIPPLVAARELESVYAMLHALTRSSLGDFFIRVAALEALVADARSPLAPEAMAEVLYWLNEPAREAVIRTLRQSGWLTYDTWGGYRISPTGHFVATVLSFLRTRAREGDLRPTVEGIDYMIRLGVDPVRQVLLLRSRLEDLRSEMEEARSSHSEVILRAASRRITEALELSERIREVLGHVSLDMVEARRVAQDVHELLSRLHGVGSDLHAAITEVGRQYLHLVAGLSTSDIVMTLMRLPVEELANAAKASIRPVFRKPLFVLPELLGSAAEAYLTRDLAEERITKWIDPPEPESAAGAADIPVEVQEFLHDLDLLVSAHQSELLSTFLPRRTPGESFLRSSLLPLLKQRIGGEGVAGRLGAMQLNFAVEANGALVPAAPPLSKLSAGRIGVQVEVDNDE